VEEAGTAEAAAAEAGSGHDRFLMPGEQYLSREFLRFGRRRRRHWQSERPLSRRYPCIWARNALYHGLAALGLVPGDRVLLPAYICAAAVEPFMAYGVTVDFYEVPRDCRVDVADIEARIDHRTRAVMCAHYFGFPQRIDGLRDLCDRHGTFLIEDCAHVLPDATMDAGMGSLGDVAVFSWRKLLPIGDGAELVVNRAGCEALVHWERESLLVSLKVINDLCHQVAARSGSTLVRTLYRVLQSPKRLLGSRARRTLIPVEDDRAPFEARMVSFPMTRVSTWVLQHSDLAAIRARRRENYGFLLAAMAGLTGVTLPFAELPEGVCPWVFPVVLDGLANPHWRLRARGIPAVSWGGVRHPSLPRDRFPGAEFLYDNLIFLPVHQSLGVRDLSLVVDGVKELLRGRA
jgi:dTDP-4-amino-4,6-dideoxygalactose transaminase